MAGSRKKRSSKKPSRREKAARVLGALGRWASLVAIAVLIAGGIVASLHVRDALIGDRRFDLTDWNFEFGDLPAWVTPEIRAELESVRLADVATDGEAAPTLFERGVLDRVKEVLERSAWIERVESLEVLYPSAERDGALRVGVALRRPIALVEHGRLHYLVDRHGRRLGAPYEYAPIEWFRIPSIRGVPGATAPPPRGSFWRSRHVENGLAVARMIADRGFLEEFADRPIREIDVSNLGGVLDPGRSEVVLLWEGVRMTWGRAPLSRAPATIPVDGILANLREVLSEPRVYERCREIHLHRSPMTVLRPASGPIESES